MTNKAITQTAAAAALALVLGYIESLLPGFVPIPGIKIGLSNLAVIYALYRIDAKSAWGVMLIKVTLSSLLFSGMQAFWFSMSGGALSLLGMSYLKKKDAVSIIGTSVSGGVLHNLGQLAAAAFWLKSVSVFLYLPPLILGGAVCGIIIGIVCKTVFRYIPL